MTDESRAEPPLRPDAEYVSELSEARKKAWELQRDLLEMAKEEDTPEHMRAVLLERVRLVQAVNDGLEEHWRWTKAREGDLKMLAQAQASNHLAGEANNTAKAVARATWVLAGATIVLAVATVALIWATLTA